MKSACKSSKSESEESSEEYDEDEIKELERQLEKLKLKNNLKKKREERIKFGIQPNFGKFREVEPLLHYYPSECMKLAQTKKFSMPHLIRAKPCLQKYIDQPQLEPDSINVALRMLLDIEDLHNMLPYCSLYQKMVDIQQDGDFLKFKINVPKNVNIDDILSTDIDQVVFVPPLSTAQEAKNIKYPVDILRIHGDEETGDQSLSRHVRTLKKIEKDIAYVEMYEDDDDDEDDVDRGTMKKKKNSKKQPPSNPPFDLTKPYDVIFRPMRYTFRVQHRALDLLNDTKRNYIFPMGNAIQAKPNVNLSLDIINEEISKNPEQLQAVKQIVGGVVTRSPYIVVGPPGTGKTTTIVEAILQLYIKDKNCRILVTAGSNSACDTVALKICEIFNNNIRLMQLSDERSGKNADGKSEPPLDILRVFSKSWVRKHGYKNINPLIKRHANFYSGGIVSPAVGVLKKYNILVVTLCTMGRMRTGVVGNWPFTHVFVDEASAIIETEALVAITSVDTNRCNIIMSGDTKQLGPVVMSRTAAELGLKHSLMERLLDRECYAVKVDGSYDVTLQTRLRRNYRSHPEILRLFNHLYYNNELIANVNTESLMNLKKLSISTNNKFPIIFEAVHGHLGYAGGSKSSYNKAEIDKLIWVIFQLQKWLDKDLTKIGIVSPYRLQCHRIKMELKRRKLNGIEVGTAEIYQGREKPIMIASFVKSFCHLGFVTDPQRLNVILSRAQSLLILIGNPRTLDRNNDFKYLIDECKRMGTFHNYS